MTWIFLISKNIHFYKILNAFDFFVGKSLGKLLTLLIAALGKEALLYISYLFSCSSLNADTSILRKDNRY